MALSEQERKLLEQLEASLMADDPKLAETLRGTSSIRIHRRRATVAGLGFIAGVVVLIAGVQINPLVSIGGFLLMLAAAIIAVNSWQRVAGEDDKGESPARPDDHPGPKPTSQDFMEKLEERWRRRQDGGDL
ncbi:DUF3040 domain-containing protein [Tessaracoccus sp. OS52]|uniref:DUF3040 domain-containing protein n=1 Tax=Tessaracoccus sp. OS52 TaxID=2886691 RepID=UPI001D128655|nr:DUF3040 domain-containing protein [Tessaracoccus sp. OS52]MCC2593398.1 DUF3040 domain-containing protein [Tessaracoccus sp. OS52]